MAYRLLIGDKRWSSWSMRPWLAMRHAGIAFEEQRVPLRRPDTAAALARLSPSGRVPVLLADALTIWDSLAIIEWIAERHPEAGLWPEPVAARAEARSVAAEMHSGFADLRHELPTDFLACHPLPALSELATADIRRLVALIGGCRARHGAGGPYLAGAFSAVDAMLAPVATRFRTYGVPLRDFGDDGAAADYVTAIFALPAMQDWLEGARHETSS